MPEHLTGPHSLDRAYRLYASRALTAAMRVLRDPAADEDVARMSSSACGAVDWLPDSQRDAVLLAFDRGVTARESLEAIAA